EILIIDEVLAVGDAEFQKKCLGKMDEVSKGEGRTILFVSHNMGAVESLCSHGIILENGKTFFNGDVEIAIAKFLNNTVLNNSLLNESHIVNLHNHHNKKYNRTLGLQKVEVFVNGKPSTILSSGDDLMLKFHVKFDNLFLNPV